MKEGMNFFYHLNIFNTLICQLSRMDVMHKDEDKVASLLYSLLESWDHLIISMWSNSINSIDYDIVVGALLSKEMRRRSTKETSIEEAMVSRG
jgi:hypothetical protein